LGGDGHAVRKRGIEPLGTFAGSAVAGVEVKAGATVGEADLRGLRKLRDAAGERFVAGVVLYDGSATINFRDGLFAVPVRKLWEAS